MRTKKENNFFDLLTKSVEEGVDHAKGKITLKTESMVLPDAPPSFSKKLIKKIREDIGVSQPVLASILGCTPSAVKSWERGDNHPNGPARRLLQLLQNRPEVLIGCQPKKK